MALRVQKERDSLAQEAAALKEKLELVQAQVAKATRDRELLLSETETSRERFDKVSQSLVKVQVGALVARCLTFHVSRFTFDV